MIDLIKTDTSNPDFVNLVKELDSFLAITDGDDHEFYDQFNQLNSIKHVIIAYEGSIAVGCGAIKEYDATTMEIKRMFTKSNFRGNGIASEILQALETWAQSLNYTSCILETGVRQVEAVSLYIKRGYCQIENYGQYTDVVDSVCFKKVLNK
ncbi:N-acetyltransferase [Patiriisocius marinus]|uniref:N-acetyltransferase n=1 Tax=Patiriisocius marinus TaxID=1397112 RepID=A0A5J4IZP0_9FLAO|nr:GNAT family N-acetyltransferase [Patiriisocius marinus]GER58963.1 N-acetyltransferase [Patiriisocius marinus]